MEGESLLPMKLSMTTSRNNGENGEWMGIVEKTFDRTRQP